MLSASTTGSRIFSRRISVEQADEGPGGAFADFAHGGYVLASRVVPTRWAYHPWGYLNDESSFQPEAGECYEALAAVKGKIIFNSSAGPSWYADARRGSLGTPSSENHLRIGTCEVSPIKW